MRSRKAVTACLAATVAVVIAGGLARAASFGPFHVARPSAPPTAVPTAPVATPSIFDRAETASDRAAAADPDIKSAVVHLTQDNTAVPADWVPGSADPHSLRVVMEHLGTGERTLVVFRTAKGRVCAYLSEATGGCYAALPAGVPIDVTAGDLDGAGGGGPVVWGFATNNVRDVTLYAGSRTYAAKVGQNGYFYEFPPNFDLGSVSRITVRYANGTSADVPADVSTP